MKEGKIQPQAVDMEEGVLGAILLEQDGLCQVNDILMANHFYKLENKLVYEAILKLDNEGAQIDILTVTQELKNKNNLERIGGAFYVSSLTNRITSSANIRSHAAIVVQKALLRELITKGNLILSDAYEEGADALQLIEKYIYDLEKVLSNCSVGSFDTMKSMSESYLINLAERLAKTVPIGVPTGIGKIDHLIGGFVKSNLIIAAARPGMGKSAFMTTVARNAAFNLKMPVGIFSLEMSSEEIMGRIVSAECQIAGTDLRNGDITLEQFETIERKLNELAKNLIYIDDTGGLQITTLKQKLRKMVKDFCCKIIFIDYLQLLNTSEYKNDKTRQVGDISHKLKQYAKEFNVPIVALCQLNRASESRQDKKPMLSDLRESGDLEQDADLVLLLCRPEQYDQDSIEFDGTLTDSKGKVIIDVAKNRHGACRTELCGFSGEFTMMYDL